MVNQGKSDIAIARRMTGEGDYLLQYAKKYIKEYPNQFLTFSMPVNANVYKIKPIISLFFEGLIPEGWLLDIASKSWRINRNDRMGLLLAC